MFFVFKQKTAYEMRISDWSSDVGSSDLEVVVASGRPNERPPSLSQERGGRPRRGIRARVRRHVLRQRLAREPHEQRRAMVYVLERIHVGPQIGRASCRDNVCQYVLVSVVAVSLKKKNQ